MSIKLQKCRLKKPSPKNFILIISTTSHLYFKTLYIKKRLFSFSFYLSLPYLTHFHPLNGSKSSHPPHPFYIHSYIHTYIHTLPSYNTPKHIPSTLDTPIIKLPHPPIDAHPIKTIIISHISPTVSSDDVFSPPVN